MIERSRLVLARRSSKPPTHAGVYIPASVPHERTDSRTAVAAYARYLVNGRPQAACTQPAAPGMVVENDSEQSKRLSPRLGGHAVSWKATTSACSARRAATASFRRWRTASASRHPSTRTCFPSRDLDASHPDIFIDRNRCVLCGRCVRSSCDLDGKNVFQFVGRGLGEAWWR